MTTIITPDDRTVIYAIPTPRADTLEVLVWWRDQHAITPNSTLNPIVLSDRDDLLGLAVQAVAFRGQRDPAVRAYCRPDGTRILSGWVTDDNEMRLMWGTYTVTSIISGTAPTVEAAKAATEAHLRALGWEAP